MKFVMEVITIESRAFKQLVEKLEVLSEYVYSQQQLAEGNEDDAWVDSQDICRFLKISERTLQRLRTNGQISYSCIGGKYYYQICHIKKLLSERLIKSTDERFRDLVEHPKQALKK